MIRRAVCTVLFGAASFAANAGVRDHRYDALGRLVQTCNARPGEAELTNYSFDPSGNRQNYSNPNLDILLTPDSGIFSPNGKFVLWMQADNNLVANGNFGSGRVPLGWSTNTVGSGAVLAHFQSDGNLALYTSAGVSVWAAHTGGSRCANIAAHDDGNILITVRYRRHPVANEYGRTLTRACESMGRTRSCDGSPPHSQPSTGGTPTLTYINLERPQHTQRLISTGWSPDGMLAATFAIVAFRHLARG